MHQNMPDKCLMQRWNAHHINGFERGVHVVMVLTCNGKSLVPYRPETHIILLVEWVLTTECQSTNLCSWSDRVLNAFQFFIKFINLICEAL